MQLQALTYFWLSIEYFKRLCFLYPTLTGLNKVQEVDTATCFSLAAAGVSAARPAVVPARLMHQWWECSDDLPFPRNQKHTVSE